MNDSLKEIIEKQKAEAESKLAELNQLKQISESEFPDLQRHVNRWNKERFYSKKANARTTDYDMSHNCGCCNDSPLEMWPFLIHNGTKIYSDPPCFTIGERNAYGSGERPYDGWKEKLQNAGIPDVLIQKAQRMFEENPPVDCEDDES